MPEDSYRTEPGERKAWDALAGRDPRTVARNSQAVYDESDGRYTLAVFGDTFRVDPAKRTIENITGPGRPYEHLLGLSIPTYLSGALPIPPSGELVKEFPGGDFFFRGAHTLPLAEISAMYARDCEGFTKACASGLGGGPAMIGDCGWTFNVFPRVSMTFALWIEDDEFPARAALFFDSNASRHVALDVLWSVALVACQRLIAYKK